MCLLEIQIISKQKLVPKKNKQPNKYNKTRTKNFLNSAKSFSFYSAFRSQSPNSDHIERINRLSMTTKWAS